MSAPNVDPRWATQTNYTSDGDVWAGDPTRVDPGSGRRAEGAEPDSFPAEWGNWLWGTFGDWLYYFIGRLGGLTGVGEWSYESTRIRKIVVPGAAVVPGLGGWLSQDGSFAQSSVNGKYAVVNLTPYLVSGSVLDSIIFNVSSSSASASGIAVDVWKATEYGAETQLGTTSHGTTSAAASTPTVSSIAHTVDRATYSYFARILSTNSAATLPAGDRLYALTIGFHDPGPRNF